MATYHKLALTASLALATALTLSCSGDGGNEPPPGGTSSENIASSSSDVSSGNPSSSSVGSSSSYVCEGWTEVVTTAPTCVAKGLKTLTCANNPSDMKTEDIPQLDYVWTVTTPATCEAAGEETMACPGNVSPPAGTRAIVQLDWGEWVITTPTTCIAEGVETMACPGNASPAKTRAIDKLEATSTQLCDARDGKLYKFVSIDTQTWMAENLSFNASGSKCYAEGVDGVSADSVAKNCATYGRLYNWSTAMNNSSGVQGVCPSGWHLPSDAEWGALMQFVNPSCTPTDIICAAGTELKANSSLWSTNTGTDDLGFSALPGGSGDANGNFSNVGTRSIWWSGTESDLTSTAYNRLMYYDNANVNRASVAKSRLYSVRCVRD
jgi:Fibrobacter succinogenes major domain (Fib_succ_major).